MFRAGQPNPYDDIVGKTTDENLTGENWELILNLCDKVSDEKEQGARNVIAAVLKRLAHRNPNVQLYTLTLSESLSKNCGIEVHREIASRAFTQGLEKLITDRTTHDKVRRRALSLIAMWTTDFENDPTLGVMEECYESMKTKGYKFETPVEAPPPDVDDEVRRREEEELQRALEMSVHDKGGRSQWDAYSLASTNGAGGSSAAANPAPARQQTLTQQPTYGGYVPSARPAVSTAPDPSPSPTGSSATAATPAAEATTTPTSARDSGPIVTRVRALHTFEPSEAGELAFEKGDIIKVVDRGYKDWWRGQLKGRTGIFPVNYVEPMPEPTAAEIAREAEQEAVVFSQAANVDRLLTLLREMDPAKDNLADNEEIQELYRSCMGLRPKIVKLIDKYSQKRADLVSMNESFVKARTIFDRMMEDSLARHAAMYDARPPYPQQQSQPFVGLPDSGARQDFPGGPQPYGWNQPAYDQPGYNAFPTPAPVAAYPAGPEPYPPTSQPQYDSTPYAQRPQSMYPPAQSYGGAPPQGAPSPYGGPQPERQGYPVSQSPGQLNIQPIVVQQPEVSPQPQPQAQPQPYQVPPQAQPQLQIQVQPELQPRQQSPSQQPQQQQSQQQPQLQQQLQPQAQPQGQQQPHSQPQAQAQPQQQTQKSGPPYVYDPTTTYADPNVQAWAQYYAHGGTDHTGAVYFISIPGIKEGPAPAAKISRSDSHRASAVSPQQQGTPAQGYSAFGPAQQSTAELSAYGPGLPQQQPGFAQSASPGGASTGQAGSPYGGAPGHAQSGPPSAEAQGPWQGQYFGLQNQFAGLEVTGEERQGVGAPA